MYAISWCKEERSDVLAVLEACVSAVPLRFLDFSVRGGDMLCRVVGL